MEALIISAISVGCAVVGAIVGIFTYKRNKEKDLKSEVKTDTQVKIEMNAKLDAILSNNAKMESSVKELGDKFVDFKDEIITRLTRVEERCEFAHQRLDKINKKK